MFKIMTNKLLPLLIICVMLIGLTGCIGENGSNIHLQKTIFESEMGKKIAVSIAVTKKGKIVIFAKNENEVAVNAEIEMEFYDASGRLLGENSEFLIGFAAGKEIATEIYDVPESWDSYRIYVKYVEQTEEKIYDDQIELIHNNNVADEIIAVQVKNNSQDTIEDIKVAVVYYQGDKVVDVDYDSEEVKAGRNANFNFQYFLDELKFDNYKIFLVEAYTYEGYTYEEYSSEDTTSTNNSLSSNSQENIFENELEKNVTATSAVSESGKMVVFAKNENKEPVEITVEVEYYDADGLILGSEKRLIEAVGAGSETAIEMWNTVKSWDNYKLYVDVEEIKRIIYYDQIELTHNDNGSKVILQVKNNSQDTIEHIQVAVVFYKGDKVVDISSRFLSDVKSGRKSTLDFLYPFDELEFDNYKVFVVESSSYKVDTSVIGVSTETNNSSSSNSQESILNSELEKNIITSAVIFEDRRFLVFVKNENKVNVNTEVEVELYDANGKIVQFYSKSLKGLGTDVEIADQFWDIPESFDNYKIYTYTEQATDTSYYDQIELTHNDNGKEIIVQAKNNSNDTHKRISVIVIYYQGDKIVYTSTSEGKDVKNGGIGYFPFDSSPYGVESDNYKVYLTDVYPE